MANVADGTASNRFEDWQAIKSKDGYVFSCTVGTFSSNGFGLHDMHGNVWEWCSDWYDADYYVSSPQQDPQGADEGAFRVYRGGSWRLSSQNCRSAARSRFLPEFRDESLGFRVLRSSVQ